MELKKVQSMVTKCYIIVAVMLVGLLGYSIMNFVNFLKDSSGLIFKQEFILVEIIIAWILCIGIYINVLQMLRYIKKNKTPFTSYVVKRIKMASLFLFCWEPSIYLLETLNRFFPYINEDGIAIVETHSFGGILMILAIGLYLIAVIFQYGVALQKQSDETL